MNTSIRTAFFLLLFQFLCYPVVTETEEDRHSHLSFNQEKIAYLLAVGATLLPIYAAAKISKASTSGDNDILIVPLYLEGILLGPSVGQFYLGSWGHGIGATAVRTVGGLVAAIGFIDYDRSKEMCREDSRSNGICGGSDGGGAIIAGLMIYAVGTIYSLSQTHFAAQKEKSQQAEGKSSGWSPTLVSNREGDIKPGAIAWIHF